MIPMVRVLSPGDGLVYIDGILYKVTSGFLPDIPGILEFMGYTVVGNIRDNYTPYRPALPGDISF